MIHYFLIFNTVLMGLLSFLHAYIEPYLSRVLVRLFLYGKYNLKTIRHPIIAKFEMPKRYFGQFYALYTPIYFILFCLILNKYLYNKSVPERLLSLLDATLGASRKPLVSAESTILSILIVSIHVAKRAYETYYVCVYSDTSINIYLYVFTFLYYLTLMLSLIGESEGFVRSSQASFSFHKFTTIQFICAFIFLWSTYMQLRSNYILAGLRKNKHGDVVTKEHKIPFGELFNYVSSPLQLTEILMYLMLSAILWQSTTIHYFTIFVIMNQVECAILANHWYRNTFKNYPKERKLLIPYIW